MAISAKARLSGFENTLCLGDSPFVVIIPVTVKPLLARATNKKVNEEKKSQHSMHLVRGASSKSVTQAQTCPNAPPLPPQLSVLKVLRHCRSKFASTGYRKRKWKAIPAKQCCVFLVVF